MQGKHIFTISIALAFLWLVDSSHAQISFRTVALSGEQAPGFPPGNTFKPVFRIPSINNAGRVSFGGSTLGANNFGGIWSDASGNLELLAQGNTPAPLPDHLYYDMGSPVLSDGGQTAWCGTMLRTTPPTGILTTLFAGDSGHINVVAYDNMPAPGAGPQGVFNPCVRDGLIYLPTINQQGNLGFYSRLSLAGAPYAIWTRTQLLNLVTKTGDPAPGLGSGVTFTQFGTGPDPENPTLRAGFIPLNDLGEISFYGRVTGTGINSTNNRGIWMQNGTSLELRVRSGSPAAGIDGALFSEFGEPAINNGGRLAFFGTLAGANIDATNDRGVWSTGSGPLSLLARKGSPAPGIGNGIVFAEFSEASGTNVVISAGGEISFSATLGGPGVTANDDSGIWAQRNGVLGLIAREGSPAPGMAPGVSFSAAQPGDFRTFMNDQGQLVFVASLSGPGVDSIHDQGIWWADTSGVVKKIVTEGDVLEVRPGDLRTLSGISSSFYSSGGQDGMRRMLNNSGELAFMASFTDGSQAIIVATIPEPGTISLLMLGVTTIVRRRCKQR